MHKPNPFSWLLIVPLLLSQCASMVGKQVETRTIWESGDGYVRLFREVGGTNRYDHPHPFHEGDLTRMLESVWYSKHRFFRWSSSMRVFEDDQAATLAPFLQRAFLQAGPEEVVDFYLPLSERSLLGLSGRTYLTRGRAFVRAGRLHLHFHNVQQKIRSYSSHKHDQEPLPPSGWKLVARDGQAYGTEGTDGRIRSENLHWLTIDLAVNPVPSVAQQVLPAPVAAARDAAPAPAPAISPAGRGAVVDGIDPLPEDPLTPRATRARETLRELKEMQEEGLISPDDYTRKKQEILDRL